MSPTESVPISIETQARHEDYFRKLMRAQQVRADPYKEVRRLEDRQQALEEIVAMFRFYLDARPGAILIQTESGGGMDLREWIGQKLAEAERAEVAYQIGK